MAMFNINDSEIQEFEAELKTFASRALPFATRNTLNQAAFTAQRFAKDGIGDKMINRNRFTKQSVQVDQARTLTIPRQSSTVGSIADYMADQESGAVKSKSGREGVSIATSYSSGEGMSTQPRKKLSRKPNKLASIQLRKGRRRPPGQPKNRKQALVFKVQDAVTSGNRFFFHNFGGGKKKGVFRVVGGNRSYKRGWPKGAKLRMVHDMTQEAVVIPRNPWLEPAFDKTVPLIPSMYRDSLLFQLKRFNLFQG